MNSAQSWTVMAIDLDRAFARAGLTTHEATLLQFVREHSWGRATRRKGKGREWPDPLAVAWNPVEIGRRIGESRVRLSEAKTSLVKSRMLIETRAGLLINKNADQWVIPTGSNAGKPRITQAAIAYAMSAWPNPEASEIPDESVRETGHKVSGKPDMKCPEIRTEASGNPDADVRETGQRSPGNRTAPYKDRTRGDSPRVEEEEEKQAGNSRACLPAPGRRVDPEHSAYRPSRPSLRDQVDPDYSPSGAITPNPAEIARALAFNDRHLIRDDIARGITDSESHFDSSWFLRALKRLKLRGKSFGWGLVRSVLIDWHKSGAPDQGPEDDYDDAMNPLPATPGILPLQSTRQIALEVKLNAIFDASEAIK